jgi:hypothetical protein
MPIRVWDDSTVWTDDGIWGEDPTEIRLAISGATRQFNSNEAISRLRIGGATITTVQRGERPSVAVIDCCRSTSVAGASLQLGGATWDASRKTAADGLARYYPLWRDDQAAIDAEKAGTAAQLAFISRDIAHGIDAGASGPMIAAANGRLCEVPEQLRGARSFDLPIDTLRDPQPELQPGDEPYQFRQWEYASGFTVSMLFRRYEQKQEQTLFSLGDSLRVGVSWLGEVVIEATLADGSIVRNWSTARLPTGEWRHVAFTFEPRGLARAYIEGAGAASVNVASGLGAVDYSAIGRWAGGSLLWGDLQDVRIYDHVKRSEFVASEASSYCADWVEVA